MAFDKSAGIGQTPFFSGAPLTPEALPDTLPMTPGVGPNARPPRLWAPLQVPQQTSDQVNLLNKTAPITADTRPYVDDAAGAGYGGLAGFADILGGINGG